MRRTDRTRPGFTSPLKFAQQLVAECVGQGEVGVEHLGKGQGEIVVERVGKGQGEIVVERVGKEQGEIVVDATVGNGKDTFFLSQVVGESGKVYGFDIQQAALDKAKAYLCEQLGGQSIDSHIILFKESHADMLQFIPADEHGHVGAVMFNLGYLPGGDHSIITTAQSTLPALEAALQLLRPGGLLTIMIYWGHPGGEEEAVQVKTWANELPQQTYQVMLYQFINQQNNPPFLIAVFKK